MKKVESQERRRRSTGARSTATRSEGSQSTDRDTNGARATDDRSDGQFDSAVDRLERAIDDLVDSSPVDEQATEYVERAGRRLRSEARKRRRDGRPEQRTADRDDYGDRDRRGHDDEYGDDDEYDDDRSLRAEVWWGGNSNWNRRWEWGGRNRSRKLYRDTENEKIGGVCAGIANYYGMEAWVVRCIAVTGLIFMPSVTLPAYWIAYFAMDKPPRKKQRKRRKLKRVATVRRRRRDRTEDRVDDHDREPLEESFDEVIEEAEPARPAASRALAAPNPAQELGLHWSPRASLRYIHSDLDEIELRLRRMESHITSGQYELQRELKKIGAES